jgi:hypothetical protein
MKSLCVILISMALTACATFDNNEYARLVDMRHELRESRCADDLEARRMVASVMSNTEWIMIYSQYLPSNKNTVNMLAAYSEGVREFDEAYQRTTPSVIFCRLKVRNLHDQLDIMLATTARRPR